MYICWANVTLILAYIFYLTQRAWQIAPKTMDLALTRDVEQVATQLLKTTGFRLKTCNVLQSLWAGYGHICHVTVDIKGAPSAEPVSMILKHINPPATRTNGSLPSEGHIRKILSYQIEQFFYCHLAPQMPKDIAIASCLVSASTGANSSATAMLLSDLRKTYPVAGERRAELSEWQTYAALEWLARFHGFWWTRVKGFDRTELCVPPLEYFQKHATTVLKAGGVWLNGGYT
jgi:hypothetical protein